MTEQSWTDDPITAGQNRIRKKSLHFTELQDAINAWESAYSIANTNYTDSPEPQVKINTTAILEMRDAIDDLYQLANSTSFTWSDTITLTFPIKPVHINELRTNINILQDEYCYLCDLCDTEGTTCTCDSTCNNDACDQCDTGCYGYSGCTCNNTCYSYDKLGCYVCNDRCYGYSGCTCNSSCNNDACDQCDSSCYDEGTDCDQCHITNYRYPWT